MHVMQNLAIFFSLALQHIFANIVDWEIFATLSFLNFIGLGHFCKVQNLWDCAKKTWSCWRCLQTFQEAISLCHCLTWVSCLECNIYYTSNVWLMSAWHLLYVTKIKIKSLTRWSSKNLLKSWINSSV